MFPIKLLEQDAKSQSYKIAIWGEFSSLSQYGGYVLVNQIALRVPVETAIVVLFV